MIINHPVWFRFQPTQSQINSFHSKDLGWWGSNRVKDYGRCYFLPLGVYTYILLALLLTNEIKNCQFKIVNTYHKFNLFSYIVFFFGPVLLKIMRLEKNFFKPETPSFMEIFKENCDCLRKCCFRVVTEQGRDFFNTVEVSEPWHCGLRLRYKFCSSNFCNTWY